MVVMRTTMPMCPQCNKRTVTHYRRENDKLIPLGPWCQWCNKPVETVDRTPPVTHNMDIKDFLSAHRKTYDLILADPPWKFEMNTVPKNREIANHYDQMSIEEIMQLPVQNIAKPMAILFLWALNPLLQQGLDVMKAWGFTYRTKITWAKFSNGKQQIGLGNNVRGSDEPLLIGKLGDFPIPKYKPPSIITAKRTEHSVKPDVFYEKIEAMYPKASRIELFARMPRAGWTSIGNQLSCPEDAAKTIQEPGEVINLEQFE